MFFTLLFHFQWKYTFGFLYDSIDGIRIAWLYIYIYMYVCIKNHLKSEITLTMNKMSSNVKNIKQEKLYSINFAIINGVA